MRYLFFIFICNTLNFCYSQTNNYQPFPDSAIWRVDVITNSPQNGGCQAIYYFQYYISGDTLINSNLYKKIYKSYVFLASTGAASPCNPLPLTELTGYWGALRDDSINNKTFFVFSNSYSDSLLYDYNLQIGDSIKSCITTNNVIITSIDSVMIGLHLRKRWNFISGYLIQGIGSNAGLTEIINTSQTTFSRLICVKNNSNPIFSSVNNSAFACNLIYQGVIEANSLNKLKINPKPFSTFTKIEMNKTVKNAKLIIYNSLGKNVKEIKNISGESIILYRDNLKCGIYFITLIEEKITYQTEKILITD